ncbi:unnamed protein product, partial [Effrenium voratum]
MIRAPLNGTPPFSELVPRPLLPGQRGDEIVWVDEEALAAALNPAMSERHRKLAAAGDRAHTLQPKAPASEDAVLTVSPRAQLPSYRGETGYVCHQDNRFRTRACSGSVR